MPDDRTTDMPPIKVIGISRDAENERVLVFHFSRRPTDYEMRQINSCMRISVNE